MRLVHTQQAPTRISKAKRDELQSRADAEQMELSEYVRHVLSL